VPPRLTGRVEGRFLGEAHQGKYETVKAGIYENAKHKGLDIAYDGRVCIEDAQGHTCVGIELIRETQCASANALTFKG